MNRDTRPYFEDASSQFATGHYTSPGGDYTSPSSYHHASYDYQQNPVPYYPPTSQINNTSHTHPYLTPGTRSHRYSNSTSSREYYSPSGVSNTSPPSQQHYTNQSYYTHQYHNGVENRSPSNQTQFIPTPSEIANSYPNYTLSPNSPPMASDHYGAGLNGYPNAVPMPPQPQHSLRPSRISTGRPRTASGATSPTSATSPSGERFPCEKCGKTFSRSHDRKRHHETQHLPTPVIHRCRFCEKEFSRADSLKRHLDNGCDEMPQ